MALPEILECFLSGPQLVLVLTAGMGILGVGGLVISSVAKYLLHESDQPCDMMVNDVTTQDDIGSRARLGQAWPDFCRSKYGGPHVIPKVPDDLAKGPS